MSEMKNIGNLSDDVISKLKKAKLMTIIRGNDVWVDDGDLAKARAIIDGDTVTKPSKKVSEENPYKLHGFIIRTPKEIKLTQSYINGLSEKTGREGTHSIIEFSKPHDGLDVSTTKKQIKMISISNKGAKETREVNLQAYTPAYSGIVMNDDNGIPLFEITPFNVFVLFDTKANEEDTKWIYQRLLIFAIMLSNKNDENALTYYNKTWERQAPIREKYEISQFRDMFLSGIKTEITGLKRKIETEDANVVTYQTELFRAIRSIEECRIKMTALQENSEKVVDKRAIEEWQKIKAFEKSGNVSNVKITPTMLSFKTRTVYWTPRQDYTLDTTKGNVTVAKGEQIELGEYEITVTVAGSFATSIKNVTRRLEYENGMWHHPHIMDGRPCLGNMTETIPKFTAHREYEAIMTCYLRWLETVTINDGFGKHAGYWVLDHQKNAEIRKAKKEAIERAAKEKAEKEKLERAALEKEVSAKIDEKKPEVVDVAVKEIKEAKENRVVRFVTE